MKHYSNDPRWITAKYAGVCAQTGQPFAVGDRVFYYPSSRQFFAGDAAEQASRDFTAAAQDEAFMNGGMEFGGENY